jgi:hypothetical protein
MSFLGLCNSFAELPSFVFLETFLDRILEFRVVVPDSGGGVWNVVIRVFFGEESGAQGGCSTCNWCWMRDIRLSASD